MNHNIHLNFTIKLQPGRYKDLDQRINDLIQELEDQLTSDYSCTVAEVCCSDWDLTISPD